MIEAANFKTDSAFGAFVLIYDERRIKTIFVEIYTDDFLRTSNGAYATSIAIVKFGNIMLLGHNYNYINSLSLRNALKIKEYNIIHLGYL